MNTTMPVEIVSVDRPEITEKHDVSIEVTALPDLAPPLLPTEQIGPKGWVRNIFFFELPEDYDIDVLTTLLKTSYKSFKDRTPVAGCEAIPMEGKQAGLLQLRHYGDEIEDFAVKDPRAEVAFPSFADLQARGFPASGLDPVLVCKRGLGGEWPGAGDHLTVTMMQANFIRGGLLLNMITLHAFADHTTAYKFTEIFAEDLMKPSGSRSDLDLAHHEYIELSFTPTAVPPKLSTPNHHGHVFYFPPPENLAALKAEASLANAKLLKDEELPAFTSTNDALTALIWRSTMIAQHPELSTPKIDFEPPATGPCQVAIALDARRRAGVSVHKHTIGNILGFSPAMLDLNKVINEASLADLAIIVRRALVKAEDTYLDELITVVDRLEDVTRLAPVVFLDMPGAHIIQSSWREFSFYDIEWGSALGGKMLALRPPAVGVTHTMQIVLPDPKRGGVEAFIGVESSAMERLLSDPVLRRYAEAPQGL
ncbi:hypothetical protein QQZ08_007819 [Neonectria magnoliae]|uniref:Trichothecene 3-O-acetyltransferase-like N-terminal domain-containing protein n=1 Tax=Neonectria magnoliae TaxID=2732573 RepID=A0ABR1HXZ3_9HYPO